MNGTTTIQYPSASEIAVVNEAQSYMKQAMARCDPSHDVYHGLPFISIAGWMATVLNVFSSATRAGDGAEYCEEPRRAQSRHARRGTGGDSS